MPAAVEGRHAVHPYQPHLHLLCNLKTGVLCSARDICLHYGGVDEQSLHSEPEDCGHDRAA